MHFELRSRGFWTIEKFSQPQPVQVTGKKVEVIEFFMYHCPACNVLEPDLLAWVKQQGDKISFRRIHMPLTGPADPEARLFLTLNAMGKEEAMHAKVFEAVHVQRIRLLKDDAIADWIGKNGIDKAKFLGVAYSFGVETKLKGLGKIMNNYKVDGTPTLVVDGRYLTSPSAVGAANPSIPRELVNKATFQVMDALVAKAQKAAAK